MLRNFSGSVLGLVLSVSLLTGCQPASYHQEAIRDESVPAEQLTVGKVQKEIRVGMSGADVIKALGSPNVVSTDDERREVWIYDKISTDSVSSSRQGGVGALVLGFGGNIAGGVGANSNYGSGASSTSQRTLTVIIKFDNIGKVRDFAYHTSRF